MSADERHSENFCFEERMGLIEMVKKNMKDIELKRNDTAANRRKQEAWSAVSDDMAASFPESPKRRPNDWKELWRTDMEPARKSGPVPVPVLKILDRYRYRYTGF